MGVSVENQDYTFRVDHLRQTHAHVKFLSLEPLLGPLTLDLSDIHWVIVGGESGSKARSMAEEWVQDIPEAMPSTAACAILLQTVGGRA